MSDAPSPALPPDLLRSYLRHIGQEWPQQPDEAALSAIVHAHALAFTWETHDAFMGHIPPMAPAAIHAKLVGQRRGGWCYEMNGLLGAALAGLGYQVTRLCAAVRREERGDTAIGNHLALRVDLDGTRWLVDIGSGDSLTRPVPLAPGAHVQGGFAVTLHAEAGGWLRFRNHPHAGAVTIDIHPHLVDEARMLAARQWLLDDPESPFVANFVVERHYGDRIAAIVNDRYRETTPQGVSERPISGSGEFAELLKGQFRLDLPALSELWARAISAGARARLLPKS